MADIYERLTNATGFDWDEGNADKSLVKHQVTNSEAEQIFFSEPLVLADDQHSSGESRFLALGTTEADRALFVVFTFRGDLIRVISARDMSKRERAAFMQSKGRQ
jgi:uncharacterized DUF497 family protein